MTTITFTYIEYMVSIFFLMLFVFHFLPFRFSKSNTFCVCVVCFSLVNLLNYWMNYRNDSEVVNVIVTVIEIIIVQGTALFLCKYRDARALFVGMTASIYVMVGDLLCTEIDVFWGTQIVALSVQVMIHIVLLLILVHLLQAKWKMELALREKGWGRLCVLPALLYMTAYFLSRWPVDLYKRPENGLPLLIIMLLMLYCYALILEILSTDRSESNMQRNNEFLETYANGLQREMAIINEKEAEMRIYRHDTRHTYRLIETYLEADETDKLKGLLEQLNGQLDEMKPNRYCANIAVNGIISSLKKKIDENHISFDCQMDIPAQLKNLNEYELATVISNLLENAVCAAAEVSDERNRFVAIRTFPFKAQLMIEVKNTYNGAVEFSEETGLPISNHGPAHGYGLRSVQAYANKTGGILQITHDDETFCVQLLSKM